MSATVVTVEKRSIGRTRPPTDDRVHGLDALRATALLLGIALHTMFAYAPGFDWIVDDPERSPVMSVLIYWIHLFRMPLFMLLAGYFGALTVSRRGWREFGRSRALRVLAPFPVFWVLIVFPLVDTLPRSKAGEANLAPQLPPEDWWEFFAPGHLWFLWSLVQVFAIVALTAALGRLLGLRRTWAAASHLVGRLLASPVGAATAALPTVAALALEPDGIDAPASLVPDVPSLVAYGGALVVGWLLRGCPDALTRLRGRWRTHLTLAVLLTAVLMRVTGLTNPLGIGGEPSVGVHVLYAGCAWLWVYGLIGLFVEAFARPQPTVRYLADSSYWLYLTHMPVVILGQALLVGVDVPVELKALVTVTASTAVLLVSYHLLVRSTWVGGWLNGRVHPFVWPHRALARRARW